MPSNVCSSDLRTLRELVRHASPVMLAAALAISPSPASATPNDAEATHRVDAQVHYEQGVRAYRDKRFEAAIEQFLAADRLAPRAALAFNVARAYEKLQEPARALQYYRDYLRRGPDLSNRSEVEARVRELEKALAQRGVQQVTVVSNPPGATVSIDGELRGTTPSTFESTLGVHQILAQREGYEPTRVDVTLDGKQTLDLEIALRALPADADGTAVEQKTVGEDVPPSTNPGREPEAATLHPWPWVAVGAGAASLGAAGIFELLRQDAESDAENARYQPDYHFHRERMSTHQLTARVLVGVGAVLAVAGGVLALIDGAPTETEALPVAVGCNSTACTGIWNGSF